MGFPVQALDCTSKEACAVKIIEWIDQRRAHIDGNPPVFHLHSQVLEPCLLKRVVEGVGHDFLLEVPDVIVLIYLEVSKLADKANIAAMEAEVVKREAGASAYIAELRASCLGS